MTDHTARPFNQRLRIAALRIVTALVVLPLVLLTRPLWDAGWPRDLTRLFGTLLIVAAVLGRFWAILYIGSRKNQEVMQDGPYSLCRHPLYLFSTLGVAGFGLLLGSWLLAAAVTAVIYTILSRTAAREERFLRTEFGAAYEAYAQAVPRILPRAAAIRTAPQILVSIAPLRMTYRDALVFLGFLPAAMLIDWTREAGLWPMLTLP
ncbi:MAG: methyltransferase family protein [Paracoccaceae bacterium]